MPVQPNHHNLFPHQLILQRNMLNSGNQPNLNTQIPFLTTPLPEYHPPLLSDSVHGGKTDSGLTYNISASRKRSRDSTYLHYDFTAPLKQQTVSHLASFAGEDILPQFQLYQLEMDAVISQHAKKIRLELEERQKQQARLLAVAMGEGVLKKLKERDEEILRMGKLNLVLEERVKSLYVENQLLRELAQTNEATANSLRTNLEQVLLQVGGGEEHTWDVESCCGSSGGDDEGNSCYIDRKCRRCGEKESCVLLLPCRHLCLCGACGSGSHQLQACPVCSCSMTATLHVNIS